MLLATEVILIRIFAVIRLLTGCTCPLEGCFGSHSRGGRLRVKDLLREDFGRKRGQGGNASLEIISANAMSVLLVIGFNSITHCQSLRICPRCRSLFLNATWQVLQV